MKHGAFTMIPNANDKVCNETANIPMTEETWCWNHKWKPCLSLSLISMVLFTLNWFHKA